MRTLHDTTRGAGNGGALRGHADRRDPRPELQRSPRPARADRCADGRGPAACTHALGPHSVSWAKDAAIGNRLINARAETVAEKPAFRKAFRERRCLVLADGFYEWKTEGGRKRPWHITLADRDIFAFAGLWERWTPEGGEAVQSCAIITVETNEFMRPIHARMPAILPEEDQEVWLDHSKKDPAFLLPLLRPYPSKGMRGHEVSTYVNRPANNSPQCVLPLE